MTKANHRRPFSVRESKRINNSYFLKPNGYSYIKQYYKFLRVAEMIYGLDKVQ